MSTESRVILDSGHISLRRNSMYDCETYTDVPVWKWCFNEERAEGDGKANNRLNWIYLCEMFGRKLAACFFFISALLITRIFFDNYETLTQYFSISQKFYLAFSFASSFSLFPLWSTDLTRLAEHFIFEFFFLPHVWNTSEKGILHLSYMSSHALYISEY